MPVLVRLCLFFFANVIKWKFCNTTPQQSKVTEHSRLLVSRYKRWMSRKKRNVLFVVLSVSRFVCCQTNVFCQLNFVSKFCSARKTRHRLIIDLFFCCCFACVERARIIIYSVFHFSSHENFFFLLSCNHERILLVFVCLFE